jgi:hypothetical protein
VSVFVQVSEEYLDHLLVLARKINFIQSNEAARSSQGRRDVEQVLEKLRLRAISKVLTLPCWLWCLTACCLGRFCCLMRLDQCLAGAGVVILALTAATKCCATTIAAKGRPTP